MHRESFRDINNKKGEVGSIVKQCFLNEPFGEKTKVKKIISLGRGGIRVYLDNGKYDKGRNVMIIGDDSE